MIFIPQKHSNTIVLNKWGFLPPAITSSSENENGLLFQDPLLTSMMVFSGENELRDQHNTRLIFIGLYPSQRW